MAEVNVCKRRAHHDDLGVTAYLPEKIPAEFRRTPVQLAKDAVDQEREMSPTGSGYELMDNIDYDSHARGMGG